MKSSFIAILFCLAVGYTAFAQAPPPPEIVAEVNGDRITRTSLAAECLQLHGENELQALINKTLIRLECERLNITITAEEINAEILRMAQTFKLTTEKLFEAVLHERGVSPEQFRNDHIWRILALGKLAELRLHISDEELQAAFESQYGPAVRARQIVLASKAEAEEVHAELLRHPEIFRTVAMNRSIDTTTQAYGGMMYPIRRHTMHPTIENMLFSMQPGDISPIIEMLPGHFAIYRCEGFLEPVEIDAEAVKMQLWLQLRDMKIRQVADEVYTDLQNRAQLKIIFGNPALYSQYEGIAAILNGQAISIRELAEICVQRHGKDVLNDIINRLIIEQAARRESIVITEQDIDREIWEMAFNHLPLLPDGAPNIEQWLRRATEETELSVPMYRKNVVVPVLALKRLTRPHVQVTEEDIQRSFEANFGQKVRCLAITFEAHNTRRAQEVWQMANRHRTEENFGDLAAEYSFDPDLRLGRGVLPPIARYWGQPVLEREAFSLKPGELSQIILVDDLLVILFCVGYIDPSPVKIEDVKVDLITDIFEKKQQMIINRYFERLREQAIVHNHLTGEIQNPGLERAIREESTPLR